MRAFSSIITFGRFSRVLVLPAAGLFIAVAVVAIALLATGPASGQAQPAVCTDLEIDQDGDYTPGSSADLTLTFTPDGCSPGSLNREFTIFLHEDIGFPSEFDKDDVVIIAGGRFVPDWVSPSEGRGEPHEIQLPGCQSWRRGSGDPGVCDEADYPVVIELRNFKLPDQPDTVDEPYEITVGWNDGQTLTDNVRVDATLEIDGDNEIGYGETVTLLGAGFEGITSVEIYVLADGGSQACDIANSSNWSGWTRVGSAQVGSDYRFSSEFEVTSTQFRSAVRHQICAVDGAGNTNGTSISILITAGLEIVGSSEVSPGDQVTLKFIGGSGGRVDSVSVAGRQLQREMWSHSGDNLRITLPTNASGTVVITVYIGTNPVSAKVTIGDAELTVSGIPSRGASLGVQFLVRSNNLPGTEVCQVTLDGIRLAFLDEGNDRVRSSGDCPEIQRGGRFLAPVALLNENGSINSDLINKLLDSEERRSWKSPATPACMPPQISRWPRPS